MADNTTLNPGASGDPIVTREISHGGDTAKLQGTFLMGIAGSEGAYTAAAINGDATNGLDVDVVRSALPSGASTSDNQTTIIGHLDGVEGLLTTIDADTSALAAAISGTEVQVDIVSSALPSGAATAANQSTIIGHLDGVEALLTTIDADTGGILTAVQTLDNAISGSEMQVDVVAALPAGTNNIGDVDVASIAAGDNNIGNVDIVTVPTDPFGANADAASSTGSISAKLRFIAATGIPVTGAALTALQLIDNTIIVDDAAFTPGTTSVNVAGYLADETATDSVNEGDAGAARMTLDRKQIVTSYVHADAGGATPYQNLDVDESEDEVKATAGKLFWVHAMNMTASVAYLKFYNATAANVTVGTTTPVLTFPIPTNADTNGAGFAIHFGDVGVQFSTAICIAATTGFAVSDVGAPATNAVIVNLGYS